MQDETGKSWGDLPIGEIVASVDVLNYWAVTPRSSWRPRSSTAQPHDDDQADAGHLPAPPAGRLDHALERPAGDADARHPAALMAGCAVLTKASEETPLAWAAAIRGWKEIGAPDVLDAVTGRGEAGSAVVDEVDMIQFTGSVRPAASACGPPSA